MTPHKKNIEEFLKQYLPSPSREETESDGARVLQKLRAAASEQHRPDPFPQTVSDVLPAPARLRRTRLATRTAAALAAVVILSILVGRDLISPGNVFAIVETGSLFKVEDGKFEALKVGEKVDTGTRVRTDDSSAVLKLPDGARIEMQEMSELTLEHAQDGVHIRLDDGSVRVTSARQPAAPLYVQNKNVTVPVVGTVFQSTAALPIPAQNAAEPRLTFEVFSVRPTGAAPGGGRGTGGGGSPRPVEEPCGNPRGSSPQSSLFIQLDGRRFAAHDMTLHALIAIAYSHECTIWRGSDALLGGPGWTKTAGYDVEANIPDGTPVYTKVQLLDGQAPQIQKMLQELLADSFKLVLRRETREVPGLVLTVANAAKLAPWKPGDPATLIEWQQKTGMIQSEREAAQRGAQLGQQDRTWFLGIKTPWPQVIRALKSATDRPVVDRTGITSGEYNFAFEYSRSLPPSGYLTLPPSTGVPSYPPSAPSLSVMIEQEMGLKLEATRVPMNVLVIDRAEKPSDN